MSAYFPNADLSYEVGGWPGGSQLLEDLVAGTVDPPPSWAPVVAIAAEDPVFIRGELERGEALARRAIDLDPQFRFAYAVVGFARALQGDPAGALAATEQGRRPTPRDRLRWWGAATLCCSWMLSILGSAADPVAALEWFERAAPLVEASDSDGNRHQLHRDRASALLDVDLTAAALDLQWCLRNATQEPVAWGMLIAALQHVVVALTPGMPLVFNQVVDNGRTLRVRCLQPLS